MSAVEPDPADVAARARIRLAQVEKAEAEAQLAKLAVTEQAMKVKVRADTAKRIEEANAITRDAPR